jgi:CRP/FNR family nitrogen fixation transcriptional regulator
MSLLEFPYREAPRTLDARSPAPACTLYHAGAEIYAQGDKCHGLFEVAFGAVRVYRLLADGRRQISAFHLAGETFGLEAGSIHLFFAEATCASGIHLLRQIRLESDFASELLPMALQSLVRAQEHLLVLGRQNAVERVAAFLSDMSERQGGLLEVDLPMTRMDIADYLGLTIETVSRVLTKLKNRGVVRLPSQRRVEILKRDVLRNMIS